MRHKPPHVLLLAGTAEARALSHLLAGEVRLTTSLAGVTARPAVYGGGLRTGGFGGAEGLAAYLRQAGVDALIDATHPFAATMHRHAAEAAARAARPLLRLDRPAWPPRPDWTDVADLPAAIDRLPPGATAFLATGRSAAGRLPPRTDVRLILRVLEPPADPAPGLDVMRAPPAADADAEAALFARLGVTHLVCKNSGGAGAAKLDAAARLRLPVLMIPRPAPVAGVPAVADAPAALAWVRALAGAA
ncbi:cobalt-precorrin-6A reductase [Rhodobacteraceae bacterium 2CG4]|uniref:Cobalt-precorrin-6A reductase n=1 Tax=Halovulum marinum TaxID=2662447 RepID=A0A6L5Z1M0_9RHOB|nr:precorrin-6A/cobalt-precorrin-6A reductase [Halovulum marinum]MSU90456.1 cobalt-precorrin-6A reductase [Halovulum marinum]